MLEGKGGGGQNNVFLSHRKMLLCTMVKENALGGCFKTAQDILNIIDDVPASVRWFGEM